MQQGFRRGDDLRSDLEAAGADARTDGSADVRRVRAEGIKTLEEADIQRM